MHRHNSETTVCKVCALKCTSFDHGMPAAKHALHTNEIVAATHVNGHGRHEEDGMWPRKRCRCHPEEHAAESFLRRDFVGLVGNSKDRMAGNRKMT